MIVALCIMTIAVWLTAMYGVYKEITTDKYDVQVHPGAVSYGTHSTATIPIVSMPRQHSTSVPMISGGTIRSYARSGHAMMPISTASSGYRIHTTSSATVHTVGSGGGGGFASSPSRGQGTSSRGINYSSPSIAIPTLALLTPTYAAETATPQPNAIGPRKAKPTTDGEEGDWSDNGAGDGDWWYMDEDGWRQPNVGETRIDADLGYSVTWTGSEWVKSTEYEPGTPLGDAPWHWMLLLAAGYVITKIIRLKRQIDNKIG